VSVSDAVRVVEFPPIEVVAVTVIVYVPGGVPGFDTGLPPPTEPPEPHAAMPTASPVINAAIRIHRTSRPLRSRASPRIRKAPPANQNRHCSHAQAIATILAFGQVGGTPRGRAEVGATVGTLTVNGPAAVGVTCTDGGLDAGFVTIPHGPISAPAGAVEHDRFTVPVNPPVDATSRL
jgi:hypothetical protein